MKCARYLPLLLLSSAISAHSQTVPFQDLRYRMIGPFRGGRVTAVSGVPSQPNVYYFGATGGGVFKSADGGRRWEPVSDGQFGTGSVGAIGVAESDPNVVYAGMGESPIRGNVSHGDGMYKSTDAGKTWKRIGLEDTRHIARVRVHPKDPDLVYVAALGHTFGPNEQRGVYRSKDGGKSWQKVLDRGNKAGAIDLILDPSNSRIVYAGFWEVYRKPWTLESGGPGSGLFKSTDGGDTWTELTRKPGLPKGLVGKVGITVSPANPERLWAIIEADDGGVFRSDNGGNTWTLTNSDRRLRQRAWYYSRLYADPVNADSVYVLNTGFYRSRDAGRTFTAIPTPHGDNHDLWIAPNDPNRMIESNDGGANVSFDGGRSWTDQRQPTAQFYRVFVDNDFPYNVYGAQQDNSTVRIASRSNGFSITEREWWPVGGGESGWIAPHPKNSNIVFAGSYGGMLTRYDHRTGQSRNVNAWPDNPMGWAPADIRHRFQWNFPILFSLHEPLEMYAASQVLFRSANDGQSWEVISPDLTRNDKSKQISSGGPITKDNTSVEYYCTIFTVAESPLRKGVLWTGSDDGLVQFTQNGGKNWSNVTPKDIPEWIQINSIDASPHDANTAYVAATMYKWDDFRPYLYKTADAGKTWKKITNGIPDGAFTRVIREDPARRGLLYAGTETGMYVSFDDGGNWNPLQLNMPVVPITDLAVQKREGDLVVATQGRSFYILDDLNVLHQIKDGIAKGDQYLFAPEPAYRTSGGGRGGGGGGGRGGGGTDGQNPPNGAVLWFYLKSAPKGEVTLDFLDAAGKSVRKYSSREQRRQAPAAGGEDEEGFSFGAAARLDVKAGMNRFVWDLRHTDAATFPGMILWAGQTRGPKAIPGNYRVRMTVDGTTLEQPLEIRKDPRLTEVTQQDLSRQLSISLQVRDKLSETNDAIVRIRDVRRQIDDMSARLDAKDPALKSVIDAGKELSKKITAVEQALYQTKNQSSQDPLNYPIRLNNRLAALNGVIQSADAAPTDQSNRLYEELATEINGHLQTLRVALDKDLAAFQKLARDKNVPPVIVKAKP
ncbi:MAG: glycosyl hydrolase [Candidatus Solibacter usitatus]|nr:glycosyl hydrolase [Candidatus Solibacter usitatus]